MSKWKAIEHLGIEVSNQGTIRRLDGRYVGQHKCGKGYRRVMLDGERLYVHRLVLLAFVGPCPIGHEVNHINCDRADNRLENLEYVTSSENTLHAVKMGTWPLGSKRWNARLDETIVRNMRKMHDSGATVKDIASHFGANLSTTYNVVMRNNWRHVA